MKNKLTAEFVGTLWLVLGGCGTAILAAPYVGVLGVSIAFGFTVVTMAYAVGHISVFASCSFTSSAFRSPIRP